MGNFIDLTKEGMNLFFSLQSWLIPWGDLSQVILNFMAELKWLKVTLIFTISPWMSYLIVWQFLSPKKSIKVEEFTDWDFTTLPPNTKLYKVYMPEATNIKFYRNHKDSNKIRITFISINEEMKRRHKTIGLYARDIKGYIWPITYGPYYLVYINYRL